MRKKSKKLQRQKKSLRHPYIGIVSLLLFLFCLVVVKVYTRATYPTQVHTQSKEKVVVEKTYPIPQSLQIPVLMYHYVEYVKDKNDTIRQSLNTTPDVFTQQVMTLKKEGYTFITAAELADIMDGKSPTPEKPVVLTFDDGYEDFYTDVFPVLKKHKVKAVAYVVPGLINRPNYMTGMQIQEISDSGLVEIGAHTVHHVYLKNIEKNRAMEEIIESKKILEATYHVPVVSFAYPYGAFDEQAVTIVKEAGFRTAVSTIPGILENAENRFTMYRVRPGVRTEQYLLGYLLQPPPQNFQ